MIKQNKGRTVLSSLMILLPLFAGVVLWNEFPENMVIPWASSDKTNFFTGRFFFIIVIPIILLLVHLICLVLTSKAMKGKEQNKKVVNILFWIIPVISVAFEGILFSAALEKEIGIGIIMPLILGLMFIIVGNYLPKVMPNSIVGIKVSWALRNTDNWHRTHRFAGKIWLVCGIVILACIFFPPDISISVSVISVLVAVLLPVLYSYLYYKKQVRKGEYEKSAPASKKGRTGMIISAVVFIVFIGLLLFFLFSGSIKTEFDADSLYIKASYFTDCGMNYDDIDRIEYRENMDFGDRINGFGSFKLSMGKFKNDELGYYVLYSYNKCHDVVIVFSGKNTLVLNGETPERTRNIYDNLKEKIE